MSLSIDIRAFVYERPSLSRWEWKLEGPEHSLRVAQNTIGPGGTLNGEFPMFDYGGSAPTEDQAREEASKNRRRVVDILTRYNKVQQADQLALDNRKEVV